MKNFDSIPELLKKFNSLRFNTKERLSTKQLLIDELHRQKAMFYKTHHSTYKFNRVGEFGEFKVPLNKRGYLSKFRGRRVRAICLFTGKYDRQFAIQDITNF